MTNGDDKLVREISISPCRSNPPTDSTAQYKKFLVLGSRAFKKVQKELIENPKVLALYNPAAETKVSVDAASYGLGGILMQKVDTTWKPVAYTSRSTSTTEERYVQIEKEALAITWACDKFSIYLLGIQ